MAIPAPIDESELLERAGLLAGRSLGTIADAHQLTAPADLSRHKGWVGQLIELALGATARTRPVPDFPALGIELKTIPIDARGAPRESTFVCKASLADIGSTTWATSVVRKKLARVLWVPVQADADVPLADRRVGSALLWSPTAEDEAAFAEDYEELVQLIDEGWAASITAHRGRFLQLRPKGASAASRARGIDEDGAPTMTAPRGFYLRRTFTKALILERFIVGRR